jgi:hypothetical protein
LAILRYPLEPPVPGNKSDNALLGETGAVDYVCFQRQRIAYSDKSGTKYYGRAFPDTNRIELNRDDNRVYLAMPKALSTAYQPQYRQVDVGALGIAALSAMGGDMTTKSITDAVTGAAAAGLPEFATGGLSQAIGGFNQLGGLQGNIDASSIQALTRGRVFNPFKEQVFNSMAFRTHSFNFKLFSRSMDEAKEIRQIIDYFKQGAMPRVTGTDSFDFETGEGKDAVSDVFSNADAKLAAKNRFFEVPDSFAIKFIRINPNGSMEETTDSFLHFKMHPSVITTINVNYTPDGQYTSFKRLSKQSGVEDLMVHVPAIELSLQFAETKLITAEDAGKGF